MEATFWHQKWTKGEIGFHLNQANPMLVENWHKLDLPKGSRVFVPLCGKTLDIGWLLQQGHQLVAAELSELAVKQLFEQLQITPVVTQSQTLTCYQSQNLTVWVGDIFELTGEQLGQVDAIYDRAALIALPEAMRHRYVQHLGQLTNYPPQLLATLAYDQSAIQGPPFSVSTEEVEQHYQQHYQLSLVDSFTEPGGLKGKVPASNQVWLLR